MKLDCGIRYGSKSDGYMNKPKVFKTIQTEKHEDEKNNSNIISREVNGDEHDCCYK